MVRVRITNDSAPARRTAAKKRPARTETPPVDGRRGLSERQWFIGLLVASGLLLLLTFRGCILPSGIGPKSPPAAPATPAATSTTAPAAGGEYTVEGGDTLSEIAQKTGTTVEALAEANGINLDQRVILQVGQKLKIPQ